MFRMYISDGKKLHIYSTVWKLLEEINIQELTGCTLVNPSIIARRKHNKPCRAKQTQFTEINTENRCSFTCTVTKKQNSGRY